MKAVAASEKQLLEQISVLVGGFVLGILAAYFLVDLPIDFSANLEEARRLGIVSATTLKGYAKAKDAFTYGIVALVPAAFSFASFLIWHWRVKPQEIERNTGGDVVEAKDSRWIFCLIGVVAVYCFVMFNASYFYKINENRYVGAWPFLGEEGSTLSAVQSVLSGGVFSRDFSCNYGPLLIYPLAWFMKLFGDSVMMQRVYASLLNIGAYAIVITFLYRTVSRKTVFVASTLFFLYLFSPFITLGPNASHLRVAFGFLPLLLVYQNSGKRSLIVYLAAGIAAGLSLLLSQEVGACSVIALVLFLLLENLRPWRLRSFVTEVLLVAGGSLAAVTPFLAYFASQGALGSFIGDMLTYPKLYMLGFSAYPFPEFSSFVADPFDPEWFVQYWVIFLYGAALAYLAPLLVRGKLRRQNVLQASLAVFGLLLFRSALCRPDLSHTVFAMQPAVLLVFLLLDHALQQAARAERGLERYLPALFACSVAIYFGVLVTSQAVTGWVTPYLQKYAFPHDEKWTTSPEGVQPFGVNSRGRDIVFSAPYAETLLRIDRFLTTNTSKGDFVYFFPNEAAYYYLFDRKNPTRYPFAYQAVTTQARGEVVRDLEARKPRYVVYSRATWRLDGVPEDVQVPEIVTYLQQHYVPQIDYGDVTMLQRITN